MPQAAILQPPREKRPCPMLPRTQYKNVQVGKKWPHLIQNMKFKHLEKPKARFADRQADAVFSGFKAVCCLGWAN